MLVSLTRLRIRSVFYLPQFLWLNERVVGQIRKSPGFHEGRLLGDAELTFWTMTIWQDEAGMRAFRDSGAHRKVMPRLIHWCDEAAVAGWPDRIGLPTWVEAHAWMKLRGRASKVRHPSPRHATLDFPPPRWTTERRLTPKLK